MEKKGKLELTWVGKYEEEKLEPRILIEDKSKSYGDPNTENMLIHGDNLLALMALQSEFSGKVKCIYIDPPYNTKYVMSIMKNLGDKQSLLIYCKKNQADMILPENVEVKKIPKDLLDKCNFESEVQE